MKVYKSHPVWVCGLKQLVTHNLRVYASHTLYGCVDWNTEASSKGLRDCVTPCMGVWIETCKKRKTEPLFQSHPVWVCGLKRLLARWRVWRSLSHPVWVCGLKRHPRSYYLSCYQVTPCMGVWIETKSGLNPLWRYLGHTLYGCVDWNNFLSSP